MRRADNVPVSRRRMLYNMRRADNVPVSRRRMLYNMRRAEAYQRQTRELHSA
jgi:hypothetical protein